MINYEKKPINGSINEECIDFEKLLNEYYKKRKNIENSFSYKYYC